MLKMVTVLRGGVCTKFADDNLKFFYIFINLKFFLKQKCFIYLTAQNSFVENDGKINWILLIKPEKLVPNRYRQLWNKQKLCRSNIMFQKYALPTSLPTKTIEFFVDRKYQLKVNIFIFALLMNQNNKILYFFPLSKSSWLVYLLQNSDSGCLLCWEWTFFFSSDIFFFFFFAEMSISVVGRS